ncbi:uracil-DNA glycosylase [Flavobacterium album]|nr:uracil-DNA glycosylase [Flavobacterium album]
MEQVDDFIHKLSLVSKSGDCTNLYFGNDIKSEIRRNNLRMYLSKMKNENPYHLLLGEAPGYKGCRLSGIAFTSEGILSKNDFFAGEEVQFINDAKRENEISATIVWNEISKLNKMPLIWNIYPFHPHLNDNVNTNRTPTQSELNEGKEILKSLLYIFSIKKIIALGKKPHQQLHDIGIPFCYVRHPANGGKDKFVQGINKEII